MVLHSRLRLKKRPFGTAIAYTRAGSHNAPTGEQGVQFTLCNSALKGGRSAARAARNYFRRRTAWPANTISAMGAAQSAMPRSLK